MEHRPEIRIVGGASKEKKEQVQEEIQQARFNHFESLSPKEREQLEKFEYPKSEKELALIDFANEETSRLMKEAGLEPYDIPEDNFHIVPSDIYNRVADDSGGIATTFMTKQGVILDVQHFRDKPVNFGATAVHEMLHLKAHFSMEVQEDGDQVDKTPYREGVAVRALQRHGFHGRYHQHFAGLHEAIVSETEKRLLDKLLNHPALKEEKEWLSSHEAQEKKRGLAQRKNVVEDDIIWVDKHNEDDWQSISYAQQRNVLDYVCTEIQKQFPDQYQSTDDIYKVFLNAHFTGKLLPLARLVEETFGEGSFRLLGNMDTDQQSGVLHFESLKKARARETRGS